MGVNGCDSIGIQDHPFRINRNSLFLNWIYIKLDKTRKQTIQIFFLLNYFEYIQIISAEASTCLVNDNSENTLAIGIDFVWARAQSLKSRHFSCKIA